MSSPRNPEEVLWNIFPLLLIASILVAGIILLPKINQNNFDERSRASEPSVTVTRDTVTPDVECSSLYSPVCGSDNHTYPNSCEANLAKVTQFTPGECNSVTVRRVTVSPSPMTLPTSN